MSYETYPKKSSQGKAGSKSGWTEGLGVSYPGKKLAGKRDDTDTVHCSVNTGGSGGPAAATYPKRNCGKDQFPALAGLPS